MTNNLPFEVISSIHSYDTSTLFCPAGMQKYKKQFVDSSIKTQTVCNIQSCLRLNDIDSMGDGTHLGLFNMMGTFSFRHWSVQQTVDFWMEFLTHHLEMNVDYVTIHPDVPNWNSYHKTEVRFDSECKWSDGEIGGYCTEFYTNGIEIGNIVNPLGDCIDVGFGLERLDHIVNQTTPKTKEQSLIDIIIKMIDDGYVPGYNKQGSILRKLLKMLYKMGGSIQHSFFEQEKQRQLKMSERYKKLLPKYPSQTKEWWYSTHGIEVDDYTY